MLFHLATLLVTCFLSKEAECADSRNIGYLLPGNIIPSHYDLRWIFTDDCSDKPEFNFDRTFSGSAQITMKAIKPGVEVIEMNAKNLTFSSATLSFGNGYRDVKLQPAFYGREEKVLFQLPFKLPVFQTVKLNIVFQGKMVETLGGMFIANETFQGRTQNETYKRNVIGTLLEPAQARTVYPCFDEPKYKASFTVSVDLSTCALDKGYFAFSNAPLEKTERRGESAIIQFQRTNVVLSTYLTAIGIAPFISTPTQKFNSSYPDISKTEWKDLKTWGTKGFVDSNIGRLVVKVAAFIMETFTNDFGIGYPLKKMDILNIIPQKVGMENWGVVMIKFDSSEFRTVHLLVHELSHQWFGDLVTCHWWSDVWLNEGFASYLADYGTHKYSLQLGAAEGWNIPAYSTFTLTSILSKDVLKSRPVSYWAEDPRSYPQLMDDISYKKGGSVLRMWNSVLGEKAFLKAIHKYLDDRKFNVATPAHLFKAFDSVANESLSDFGNGLPSKYFPKWITQGGYPIVTVTRSPNNMLEYILTQRVFTAGPDSHPSYWTVPISYSTSAENNFNKTHAMLWLRDDDDNNNSTAVITLPKPVNWIIVNNKFTGYYRVNYDQENWEALAEVLGNRKTYHTIPVENRMQIISDMNAVAELNSTLVDYNFVMNMLLYLQHETEYYPWEVAVDDLLIFMDMMISKNMQFYRFFQMFVNDLLNESYSRLGFKSTESDTYYDKLLRVEIMKWACKMNNTKCIRDSDSYLNTFIPSENPYNQPNDESELYSIAYCTHVRNGAYDFDTLWGKYKSAKNPVEKSAFLGGICCSTDENILERILLKTVDPSEELRNSEVLSVFQYVDEADPRNVHTTFNFFTKYYKDIAAASLGGATDILKSFGKRLGTDEELDKLYSFIREIDNDEEAGIFAIDKENVLARARRNNLWIKENGYAVNMWLMTRYGQNDL